MTGGPARRPRGTRGLWTGIAVTLVCVLTLVLLVFRNELFSSCSPQTAGPPVTLTGIVGSETVPLLVDPDVVGCLGSAGITLVPPDGGGSLKIGLRNDLGDFTYALPSSLPAAELLQGKVGDRGNRPLYTSPMIIAAHRQAAETLVAAHVATIGPDGTGTVDMQRLIDLIDGKQKWKDIPGTSLPDGRAVLLGSTDPQDSNSGAMLLAIASYVENNDQALTSDDQFAALQQSLCPIFQAQGTKPTTTEDLFNSFLAGSSVVPMAFVYEHQFRAAQNDGRLAQLAPDAVLLYPTPDVRSEYRLVSLPSPDPAAGAGVNRLQRELTVNPGIVERATALGFRLSQPLAGVDPGPPAPASIPVPAYQVLTGLADAVTRGPCR